MFKGSFFGLVFLNLFLERLGSLPENFYEALTWYLLQLRWPDQPTDSTRGITFLELTMDFEVFDRRKPCRAALSASNRLAANAFQRGASQVVRTVF